MRSVLCFIEVALSKTVCGRAARVAILAYGSGKIPLWMAVVAAI